MNDSTTENTEKTEKTEAADNWWQRLAGGLKRSSSALGAISDLVTKRKLDDATLIEIHDALVRPYPGYKMGPSLAEKWEESEDGKTYEFTLRPNLKFHNGDPLTAEDVKFSFERYKGAGASTIREHVESA